MVHDIRLQELRSRWTTAGASGLVHRGDQKLVIKRQNIEMLQEKDTTGTRERPRGDGCIEYVDTEEETTMI